MVPRQSQPHPVTVVLVATVHLVQSDRPTRPASQTASVMLVVLALVPQPTTLASVVLVTMNPVLVAVVAQPSTTRLVLVVPP